MNPRSIALALAFCVASVSTSYAQDSTEGAMGKKAYSATKTKQLHPRRKQAAKSHPHRGGAARSVTPPRAQQK